MPAMGRMYSVEFENVSVSAAQDFWEITPADDKPIRIHGIFLSQNSDFGDAQDEGIRLQIIRGFTTSGSGGTTVTANPLNPSDAAASFVAECNNTTLATTGTTKNLHSDTVVVRAGFPFYFTPETRPECSQGQTTIVIRLKAAPADALSMSGTLYLEELG